MQVVLSLKSLKISITFATSLKLICAFFVHIKINSEEVFVITITVSKENNISPHCNTLSV